MKNPTLLEASARAHSASRQRIRHYELLVRDYVVDCRIGVWGHEQGRTQRVRINLKTAVELPQSPIADSLDEVVSYDYLIDGIRRLTSGEHVCLLETLAEKLAALCLSEPRAVRAWVQVEKLDIVPESAGVGIVIERTREDY